MNLTSRLKYLIWNTIFIIYYGSGRHMESSEMLLTTNSKWVGWNRPQTTIFAAIFETLRINRSTWRIFLNMNWLQDDGFIPYLTCFRNPIWRPKKTIFFLNQRKFIISLHTMQLQMKRKWLPTYFRPCLTYICHYRHPTLPYINGYPERKVPAMKLEVEITYAHNLRWRRDSSGVWCQLITRQIITRHFITDS